LPFIKFSAEEMRQFGPNLGAESIWTHVLRTKEMINAVVAWAFVEVCVLNRLHASDLDLQAMARVLRRPPDQVQLLCLGQLYWDAANLVYGSVELPVASVPQMLSRVKLCYDGEVAQKAVQLTWAGVLPGLPPEHLSGKLSAVRLASPAVRRPLLHPELTVLPRSAWPAKLKRPRVRATQEEWDRIAGRCVARRIFKVVPEEMIIHHHGQPLLQGAFGVGKQKFVPDPEVAGRHVEVLRLIINLTASNELQGVIESDCPSLPYFGQWLGLELLEEEVLMWRAEDMECCFYVFELPDAWLPYFILAKPVSGDVVGCPGRRCWVACSVLPMGWLSAVGICQHLHKRMLQLPVEARGAGLDRASEIRKGRPLPLDGDGRLRCFTKSTSTILIAGKW